MATSGIRCDAKEKLQELEKENQSYRDYMGEPPCYDNASYIKKSKIKEKIEEIDKAIPKAQGEELLILEAKKDFAQELLEE